MLSVLTVFKVWGKGQAMKKFLRNLTCIYLFHSVGTRIAEMMRTLEWKVRHLIIYLFGMIVQVKVVFRNTVVGD